MGAILFKMGFLKEAKSPDVLLGELIVEHEDDSSDDSFSVSESDGKLSMHSRLEVREIDEELMQLNLPQPDGDELSVHQKMMSQLVAYFLRRVEHRGSDIRLDADVIFKPGNGPRSSIDPNKWEWKRCRAFRWRHTSHINLLKLKALLHAVPWRARRSRFHSFRTMILCDSQAVIAVVAKGRSSLYLLICWVDTVDNPADEASRIFDANREG